VLGFERGEAGIMEEKPKSMKASILDSWGKTLVLLISVISAVSCLVLFWYFWQLNGDLESGRTIVFTVLAVQSLIYIFGYRNLRQSIYKAGNFFSNKALFGTVVLGFATQLVALYVPFLSGILGVVPLHFEDWMLVFSVGFSMLILVEVVKSGLRRQRKNVSLGLIKEIASSIPEILSVHDIKLHEIGGRTYLELDLEFEDSLKLKEAHDLASLFEKQVKEKIEDVAEVSIHIESVTEKPTNGEIVTADVPLITNEARDIALKVKGVRDCHRISVKKIGNKYYLTMHCNVDGDALLDEVHNIGSQIERLVAERFREVAHVSVHIEPSSSENEPAD
jgi:divalent metal cation (Fe/Co/Zn/Cd) transporter